MPENVTFPLLVIDQRVQQQGWLVVCVLQGGILIQGLPAGRSSGQAVFSLSRETVSGCCLTALWMSAGASL